MKKSLSFLCFITMFGSLPALAADIVPNDQMKALIDKKMKAMDVNGDGMASKDEYMKALEKKFADRDKDKDGMLSRQEMLDSKMLEAKEIQDTGVLKQ